MYHARFLLVKFTHFQVVARVSEVGIPERSKKHVNVENFPVLLHFYVAEEKSY